MTPRKTHMLKIGGPATAFVHESIQQYCTAAWSLLVIAFIYVNPIEPVEPGDFTERKT